MEDPIDVARLLAMRDIAYWCENGRSRRRKPMAVMSPHGPSFLTQEVVDTHPGLIVSMVLAATDEYKQEAGEA